MKDRFLFRGVSVCSGEFVTGYYSFTNNCHFIDNYPNSEEVIPETVGQCTGRKDKNGKLTFEGDQFTASVLMNERGKSSAHGTYWIDVICVVVWVGCGFAGRWKIKDHKFCGKIFEGSGLRELPTTEYLEIIGNIHEAKK